MGVINATVASVSERTPARRLPPWRRLLPELTGSAPPWLLLVLGASLVGVGLYLAIRPLTSLWLLGVYTGASCIATGVAEIGRKGAPAAWWSRVIGLVWLLGGVVILIWLGRSLELFPLAVGALMAFGGISSLAGLLRGPLSARALAAAWGIAQLVLGLVALLWPDVTLLTVALFFGIRTVVFGVTLVWRGGLALTSARTSESPVTAPHRGRLGRRDALRWAGAVGALALAAGTWWLSSSLRAGLPVIDSFYDSPAEVAAEPGVLIREDTWPGTPPAAAQVRRLLYTTTDAAGDAAVASAIAVIPDRKPDGPRPVLIWAHGTTGIARSCAPSLMPDMFQIQGIPAVRDAIERGWVIVATDYAGQGTEGTFPYLIGEGEARSALDSARAAAQLDGIELSSRAVVWGHSQGGHAALWVGAIAGSYAPDLELLGTAAISPAADPLALAERMLTSSQPGLLSVVVSWVLIPYSETYDDVVFEELVAVSGRGLVREMSQRCATEPGLVVSVLGGLGLSADRPLYTLDLSTGAIRERLDENKTLGPWAAPLLIAWGGADEVIAPELQHHYVAEVCASGGDPVFTEYPGYSHMQIVSEGSSFLPQLVQWTTDRFAGEPAPDSTC